MKITLLTVGKTDVRWVREGLDLYVSRLKHYVSFSLTEIPELKNVSALSQEQIKEREGGLILAAVKPSDAVYLLDEHGRQFRSVEFARFLEERMSRGGRDPRQMTGSVSSSSRRLMDMTCTPPPLRQGNRAFSVPTAFSWMPNACGMDGPVTSASIMPTA